MKYTTPGQHRSVAEFREHLLSIDARLDCATSVDADGALRRPCRVFGMNVGNRFAVQPMEGWDGETSGLPSPDTLRRWRRFGRSGAKLVWGGEAFAVQEDGRANPNQLYLNPAVEVRAGLSRLRESLLEGHREQGESTDDLCIGLQLTHSGRFARPMGAPAPRTAFFHPVLARKLGASPPPLTDAELEGIGESFVRAARLARELGYHFVDVKCCHGYLLHELLGAKTREGPYGGTLENRTRLLGRIVRAIQNDCPGLGVGVRVSLLDTYPYFMNAQTREGEPRDFEAHLPYRFGFGMREDDPRQPDFDEPRRLLARLLELGVHAVNVSLGSPYYTPHWIRPAAYPPSDGYQPPEDPLAGVARHLEAVRWAKREFPGLTIVGSGYSYLQEYVAQVAQHEVEEGHVDFVGLGRMMLAYPELPFDVLHGRPLQRARFCRTFSDCTTAPRNGMVSGCYPLDPHYKNRPEFLKVREVKSKAEALRRRS